MSKRPAFPTRRVLRPARVLRAARVLRPALVLLTATLALLVAMPASGARDRLSRLLQILRESDSYKVRLQVVINLGKLKDKRAVPTLISTLSDDNASVRAVTAAALAAIGDARALASLKRSMKSDASKFVRSQAKKAVAILDGGGAPGRGARFYVTTGKLGNNSGKGGEKLVTAFAAALIKQFGSVAGVTTRWKDGRRKPKRKELKKLGMKAYVLDGSITEVSEKRKGGNVEISCMVRVSLATFPDNSMKAFYTGGAGTAVPEGDWDESEADEIYKELVEGAAQGAKQQIVRSYLSQQ